MVVFEIGVDTVNDDGAGDDKDNTRYNWDD